MGNFELTSLLYGAISAVAGAGTQNEPFSTDFMTILTQTRIPASPFVTVICGRWNQLTGCVGTNHYPTVTDSDFWTQLTADSADSAN